VANLVRHPFKTFQAQQHGDEFVRFCVIHGGDTLHYTFHSSADAMRRVPRSLDLIGQRCPRLCHAKQRSLALGILKLVADLEAVDGALPVERNEFAGRHPPSPVRLFAKVGSGQFVPGCKKLLMSVTRKAHLSLNAR